MAKVQLYRVINPFFEQAGKEMDTSKRELTPRLYKTMELVPVFELIVYFWKDTGCQLNTAVHALSEWESYNALLQLATIRGDEEFSAQNINQYDMSIFNIHKLLTYIEQYQQLGTLLAREEEWAIWEYLWERSRVKEHSSCISRQECLFTFGSEADSKQYLIERKEEDRKYNINTHIIDKVYMVEIINQQKMETYDMRWLDNISEYSSYNLYEKVVNNYWTGRMTKHPLREVLFQGIYCLREI